MFNFEKPSREFIPNVKKKKREPQKSKNTLQTYKHVMNNGSDQIKAHFLIEMGRSDILDFPLFHEPTQSLKETYIKSVLGKTFQISASEDFMMEIYGNGENSESETQHIKEFDAAMKTKHVQCIIMWLKVVQLYLQDAGIIPEPFQIEIYAHAVFFIASIKAYKHGEVYELLKSCFDIKDEQYYKAKSCVFMVMRRQGKTEWTKIMFAAAMITLPEIKLAYYVHHVSLLDIGLSDIEMKMRRMCSLCKEMEIKSICYSKGLSKLVCTFQDNTISTLEGRSTSNPDVSKQTLNNC